MTTLSHSYSSIKMFENCPLRYYEQRVKKSVLDPGGEASIYGTRIHEAIEARLKDNTELPQDIEHYEPLVAATLNAVGNGTLVAEQELTLTKDLTPTGWWEPDAWLRSKLDVLIRKDGDQAVVMDWKTGKRRVDFFQLSLFAAQVFTHYPEINRVKTTLVWLKPMEMDSETYKREDAPAIWQDVLGRITRIEKALEYDNWPAKPSGLCPYCPCYNFCGFAQKRR